MDPLVWIILAAVAAIAVFMVWRAKGRGSSVQPARTINSSIAGVTVENDMGLSPQQLIVNMNSGDRLKLVAADKGGTPAVEVQERGGGHLGWLQDAVMSEVRAALDDGKRVDCKVADITGGTRGNPNLAVSIQIDLY